MTTADFVITPEVKADEYAANPSQATFDAVVEAVWNEYAEAGFDFRTDSVLYPTGLAVRVCADALAADDDTVVADAWSKIDFDGSDEITVKYDSFAQDDVHAVPIEIVRLAAFADANTNHTVRFRDGAGSVEIYVEVRDRDDDGDDVESKKVVN